MAEEAEIPTADDGPLNVQSAMDALVKARETQGATAEPVVVEQVRETKIEPDPASPETYEETQPEEAQPAAEAQIQAPDDWTDEDKEWFTTLSPERQAKFVERAEASKPQPQLDEMRQHYEAQARTLSERTSQLDDIVNAGAKAFQERWGKFTPQDWQALAQSDPDKYTLARATYDAEADTLNQAGKALKEARGVAQQEESRLHMETLARELPTIAPELADIKTGKLAKTVEYLKREGVPAENIPMATARELALAHKAMLYDEGQKALKAAPKPAPAPARPAARPSATVPGSSQQRTAAAISGQLSRKGDVDSAVALLQARRAMQ